MVEPLFSPKTIPEIKAERTTHLTLPGDLVKEILLHTVRASKEPAKELLNVALCCTQFAKLVTELIRNLDAEDALHLFKLDQELTLRDGELQLPDFLDEIVNQQVFGGYHAFANFIGLPSEWYFLRIAATLLSDDRVAYESLHSVASAAHQYAEDLGGSSYNSGIRPENNSHYHGLYSEGGTAWRDWIARLPVDKRNKVDEAFDRQAMYQAINLVKHRLWVPFDDLKSLYKVEGIKDKALIKRTNGLVAKIKSATRLDLGRADASTRQGMADAIEAFGKHEALLLKPMVAPKIGQPVDLRLVNGFLSASDGRGLRFTVTFADLTAEAQANLLYLTDSDDSAGEGSSAGSEGGGLEDGYVLVYQINDRVVLRHRGRTAMLHPHFRPLLLTGMRRVMKAMLAGGDGTGSWGFEKGDWGLIKEMGRFEKGRKGVTFLPKPNDQLVDLLDTLPSTPPFSYYDDLPQPLRNIQTNPHMSHAQINEDKDSDYVDGKLRLSKWAEQEVEVVKGFRVAPSAAQRAKWGYDQLDTGDAKKPQRDKVEEDEAISPASPRSGACVALRDADSKTSPETDEPLSSDTPPPPSLSATSPSTKSAGKRKAVDPPASPPSPTRPRSSGGGSLSSGLKRGDRIEPPHNTKEQKKLVRQSTSGTSTSALSSKAETAPTSFNKPPADLPPTNYAFLPTLSLFLQSLTTDIAVLNHAPSLLQAGLDSTEKLVFLLSLEEESLNRYTADLGLKAELSESAQALLRKAVKDAQWAMAVARA